MNYATRRISFVRLLNSRVLGKMQKLNLPTIMLCATISIVAAIYFHTERYSYQRIDHEGQYAVVRTDNWLHERCTVPEGMGSVSNFLETRPNAEIGFTYGIPTNLC